MISVEITYTCSECGVVEYGDADEYDDLGWAVERLEPVGWGLDPEGDQLLCDECYAEADARATAAA